MYVHGLIEIEISTLLTLCHSNAITHSNHSCYALPLIRTEAYLNLYLPSTLKLWNNLLVWLIDLDNLNDLLRTLPSPNICN